jgi:hypothetical protein
MDDKFFTLKEVRLNNHCPECYSREGLLLTFKQKFTENALYRAITHDTIHTLYCNSCETEIFPIRWTDEIEQVFNYQKRAAIPKPKSLKLKKLAWILIGIDLLIIVGIILFVTDVFN